ncbi:MAG: hypothetical protein JW809_15910 [Pirellulales bacterium]|nr:hypothetical protein [Pirellulales bacterium]
MNPLLLTFADGTTFFAGLAMVVAAEAALLVVRGRVARSAVTVAAIIGMVLVVISATPLPLWAYAVWIVSAVAGIVVLPRTPVGCVLARTNRLVILVRASTHPTWLRAACLAMLVACSAGLAAAEWPYYLCPTVVVPEGATVYVLGDSISAGMGAPGRCWPEALGEIAPVKVVNLAQPGATAASALAQAEGVAEPRSLVIVEIGGNDLLGRTDAASFARDLDALVVSLHAEGHQILIMELPLYPLQNAFGQAQRQVAAKYGAALLPKRCFTRVLGTPGTTLDGVHLSRTGHEAMAGVVAGALHCAPD